MEPGIVTGGVDRRMHVARSVSGTDVVF